MMLALHYVLCVLAGLLAVVSLLPLSKLRRGWIRVWEFPRIQIFWIAVGGALVAIVMPQEHVVMVVLAGLVDGPV